ncbi:MAG: ABC transporter ATP-binding protein [Candidatus Micrarchaeota archaeon]|nr:ABC transporter ATP-binding protein [Candidatus Micrarchaeota archaeon]
MNHKKYSSRNPIIKLVNISKRFNGFVAVKNINFEIREGEVFGLVGPNGAGKSTIVKMLCTILEPSEGSGIVDNLDLSVDGERLRKIVGYLPEEPRVYDYMTVMEYLRLFSSMYGVSDDKIFELLKKFDVYEHKDRLMGDLSKGLKQRVSICRALLHDPKILILDEPTMGLDPATARELREKIFELKKSGKTVIICTHYMDEADFLCDRVCIINNGEIIAIDSPENLKMMIKKDSETEVVFEGDEKVLQQLEKRFKKRGRAFIISGDSQESNLKTIEELKKAYSLKIIELKTVLPSLETVFVELIKNQNSYVGNNIIKPTEKSRTDT